jgi:hypothetical protein
MIDLDAAKAARREAAGEHPEPIRFGGDTFELPVELPFEVGHRLLSLLENIAAGSSAVFEDVMGVLEPLLGEGYPAFMAHGPSMPDIMELLTGLPREYGFTDMGESPASERSSQNGSRPQKPRSKEATAST